MDAAELTPARSAARLRSVFPAGKRHLERARRAANLLRGHTLAGRFPGCSEFQWLFSRSPQVCRLLTALFIELGYYQVRHRVSFGS